MPMTSINPSLEQVEDLSSDFPVPDLVRPYMIAIFTALIVTTIQLLVLLIAIRRNLLQAFRGDDSEIPRCVSSQNVDYAYENIHVAGYLIGCVLWGYILIAFFVIIVGVIIDVIITYGMVRFVESILKVIISPLLFAIFQIYMNKMLAQYAFLQQAGDVLSINHHRILMVVLYFNFFLDAFLGFISSIIRVPYGGTWFDKVKTGTSHLSAIGHNGDDVAMTSTINLYFGSTVLGTETGIIYNNEMDDFSIPNTTILFDVPASPANYIEPGKRPSSSMAPLIIFDNINERVLQVLGASGGTKITTSVAQVSMLNLWFKKDIKQAIDAPRLYSQLLPDEVLAENGFNQTILQQLRDRGHNIQCGIYGGSIVQGIEWRKQGNQLWACSDVRKNGAPDGI